MKNRNKILIILFSFISMMGHTISSQNITQKVYLSNLDTYVTIKSPSIIGINEYCCLTFSCNQKLSEYSIESSQDFNVLKGPTYSTLMSMSTNNGVTKTESTHSYSWILKAKQEGDFQLPSLVMKSNDGEAITITPPRIKVVHDHDSKSIKDTLFVKASLSKNNIQLGDSVVLSFKIYTTSASLKMNSIYINLPYCYFKEENLPDSQWETEEYNGKKYLYYIFRKFQLIPLQSGDIQIPKNEFEFAITPPADSRNAFAAFFSDSVQIMKVYTNPVTIKVIQ